MRLGFGWFSSWWSPSQGTEFQTINLNINWYRQAFPPANGRFFFDPYYFLMPTPKCDMNSCSPSLDCKDDARRVSSAVRITFGEVNHYAAYTMGWCLVPPTLHLKYPHMNMYWLKGHWQELIGSSHGPCMMSQRFLLQISQCSLPSMQMSDSLPLSAARLGPQSIMLWPFHRSRSSL